jgi:trans-AT polyketide synthase, acyltransferase and oxidoreductase domains
MALIFRWYLGLSSRWSATGEKGRELDYQVWCGPSIGPFNDWTRGTYLAEAGQPQVVDVALQMLTGSAYLARIQSLAQCGHCRCRRALAAITPSASWSEGTL